MMSSEDKPVIRFNEPNAYQTHIIESVRNAVDIAVSIGNTSAAYVYARLLGRFAIDYIAYCACDRCVERSRQYPSW